ncbi:MAG: NUDIX domain-containing protein [Spirochaetaceae bacterium]|nr:NUDIX domain-containing protein [Spirochaetaceae bacterium]
MVESVACILICNSKILLGKRLPGGDVGGLWEFPGGKVEANETHQQAIIREFQEEFSVDVQVGTYIANSSFNHKGKDFKLFAYQIFFKEENPNWILNEHTQIDWFTIDEINKLNLVDSDKKILPQIEKFFLEQHNEK